MNKWVIVKSELPTYEQQISQLMGFNDVDRKRAEQLIVDLKIEYKK